MHYQQIQPSTAAARIVEFYWTLEDKAPQTAAQIVIPDNYVNTPYPWNVTNLNGSPVASGVYIYQIKNSFTEKRGKLIIIR